MNTDAAPAPDVEWQEFWAATGNESMLAARGLIELSPTNVRDAQAWLRRAPVDVYASDAVDAPVIGNRPGAVEFDWRAWLDDYDQAGRRWSDSEHAVFALAAAMLDPNREVRLHDTLRDLGTWGPHVATILFTTLH